MPKPGIEREELVVDKDERMAAWMVHHGLELVGGFAQGFDDRVAQLRANTHLFHRLHQASLVRVHQTTPRIQQVRQETSLLCVHLQADICTFVSNDVMNV